MRISDWSSDVCSSDLRIIGRRTALALGAPRFALGTVGLQLLDLLRRQRRDQLCGDSATQYHLVMRDLARLIGEFGAGATVVLGGRVELGESAIDRKSPRLNSSPSCATRMPSSACKQHNPQSVSYILSRTHP